MQRISEVVAHTLKAMCDYASVGMTTQELDHYGGHLLQRAGARSAPHLLYGFPAFTCISVNHAAAHGIPSSKIILREGDLINIDVSAELNGYFGDNGSSFVLGKDLHGHQSLVNASREILHDAISNIKGGVAIAAIGGRIERQARQRGFRVIKNLVGHGIGRQLHEHPKEIPCFNDPSNKMRFQKNTVVALETFISTKASYVYPQSDGWTYAAKDGSYIAQHEHTLIVTDDEPIILTAANGI